jgi:DNA-3-methyladenine glycosylase II
MFLEYGKKETDYLKDRDKRLGEVIEIIGPVEREAEDDLFACLVKSIVGQQISTAAQVTIWGRIHEALGCVTPKTVCVAGTERLQQQGISFRKAEYIRELADKVCGGELDLDALSAKSDKEITTELSALRGIGVWTAEMMLTFCLRRPDVLSYGDLAIRRGMRMLYHHRNVERKLFEKYRRRYSPYGSVASLYLWEIAGGAVEGMKDYAPANRK